MSDPIVVPILNRTELNGSYLSAQADRTITLPTISVTPFYYATLILRVHEATWSGSTQSAKFKVEGFASYPSREDAREFVESSSALSAELTSADTLPAPKAATTSNLATAYKVRGDADPGRHRPGRPVRRGLCGSSAAAGVIKFGRGWRLPCHSKSSPFCLGSD